jgi:phospholipid N-methyltransferase
MPRGWTLHDHVLLASRFLLNPKTVGACAPSSRALAGAMVDHIPTASPVTVSELGPGTGAFTGPLMAQLGRGSRLLAVEVDPVFTEALHRRWPSLDVACAPAEHLPALLEARGLHAVDHVVSGLPFVSLAAPVVERTLEALARSLRPGGTFTTFQYAHCYRWRTAAAFRRDVARALEAGEPTRRLVMANLPPAYVLRWQRGSAPEVLSSKHAPSAR